MCACFPKFHFGEANAAQNVPDSCPCSSMPGCKKLWTNRTCYSKWTEISFFASLIGILTQLNFGHCYTAWLLIAEAS
jgi:hypothetical protein